MSFRELVQGVRRCATFAALYASELLLAQTRNSGDRYRRLFAQSANRTTITHVEFVVLLHRLARRLGIHDLMKLLPAHMDVKVLPINVRPIFVDLEFFDATALNLRKHRNFRERDLQPLKIW